ncbi:DUF1376 domain-containing protein [Halodurantibacterium flavum]|uniref:DUF1376 domain-containing protein n=1 Tax=Halodurantibacterium flavum TaxID=1382802 RepID=A0ABW4S8A0_9RHOB
MPDSGNDFEFWAYPLQMGDTLSNHEWIPLYVNRLLTSQFVADAIAAGRREDIGTALILWCESFKLDPAGALPDNDVQLARLAGFGSDIEAWLRARPGALYGWRVTHVEGDDRPGRRWLGHEMIARIAVDMHRRKSGRDQAREAGRMAMLRSRVRAKLRSLGRANLADNDHVVATVADWLDKSKLYCTAENVAAGMEEVAGVPRVVRRIGGKDDV